MQVGRILSPVHSLGPGERVCLWTQGCGKNCPGCISPELQGAGGTAIDNRQLASLLTAVGRKGGCAGLTISGGDPLEQPEALLELLQLVRPEFEDILVYTGYTLSQLRSGIAGESGKACLQYIDVLIDGPYEKKKNTPDCVLRGSSNQVIHYLTEGMEEAYQPYLRQGRVLENFVHGTVTIVTGILNEEEAE